MKRNSFLIISLFILIFFMTGCLPNKIPDKITGPTVATKYTIPVIKTNMYLGSNENCSDEIKLGLTGESADLSQSISGDPIEVDLLTERITVELGTIGSIQVEGVPPELLSSGGEYLVDPPKTIDFSMSGLGEYLNFTLSNDTTNYNYIDINMNGAMASGEGFSIILKAGETVKDTALIPPGENSGRLYINGLNLTPSTSLSVEASGTLSVEPGATEVSLSFTPTLVEIESFTVSAESLSNTVKDSFNTEPVESSFKLPAEFDDLDITLKTAKIIFTPTLIPNLQLSADLIIEGLDDSGTKVYPIDQIAPKTLNLISNKESELDLTEILNDLLKTKPHSINLRIENYQIEATGDLEVSYPSTVTLDYSLEIGLEKLTYSPSEGIEIGEVKLPKDVPVDFKSGYLYLDITNNSPVELTIDIWLSPNFDDLGNQPSVYNTLIIPPQNESKRTVIGLDEKEYYYLTDTETGMIYYQISITNNSVSKETITDQHFLEIKAWIEAQCLINKQ